MRFLYADSEPFPPMYDFIAALDSFVVHAARVVQLDAEIRTLRAQAEDARTARRKSEEELETFHKTTMKELEERLPEGADAAAQEYVRRLSEIAVQVVTDTKKTLSAAEEHDVQIERQEVGRRRTEVHGELQAFLTMLRLPVLDVHVSLQLTDNANELSAVFTYSNGIVAAFTLDAMKIAEWRQPRRVAEFATDIELPVGVKRGWFSKSVHQEKAVIDDLLIGSFNLEADRLEIRLRRKPTDKDTLELVLQREDGQVTAEVHHLDDPEAEGQRNPLDADAVANLTRLWAGLRQGLDTALTERKSMQSVEFRGADVVALDHGADFVRQVVALLAPVVTEISKRTPNTAELTLKLEKDGGRREEIYVRKADLASKLDALAPELRKVFSPLGIMTEARPDSSPFIETGELAAEDLIPPIEVE